MKVALCFIISYEHILNKEQLWIDWIKPNQDIINIYFHYKDINKIKSSWIKLYTIPPNLIAKKNASTWRSLGFCVHELDCEDIWHGGFGLFNEESLIIYLSNSGNTIEIINIAKHIQQHFKSTTQIALTCNKNSIFC